MLILFCRNTNKNMLNLFYLRATGIFSKISCTKELLLNIPNKTQCFRTFDNATELP